MASKLNPNAPEFVPVHAQEAWSWTAWDPEAEEGLTSEELEELEACEQWCETMAELAEREREHLISLALEQAPKEQILEVELKHMLDQPATAAGRRNGKGKGARQPHAHKE